MPTHSFPVILPLSHRIRLFSPAKSEATSAAWALFQAQAALAPALLSQPFGRSKTLNLSQLLMSLTSVQTQPHAVQRKTSDFSLEEKWIERYWCTCNLVVICWHFRIDANSTGMDGILSLWFNELWISSGEGNWTVIKKIYSYINKNASYKIQVRSLQICPHLKP